MSHNSNCHDEGYDCLYIIKGPPAHFYHEKGPTEPLMTPYRHLKMMQKIELERQMPSEKLYTGPLSLHVHFYFRLPIKSTTKKKELNDFSPHTHFPDIGNCIRYLEKIGAGTLFSNEGEIASVSAIKYYSKEPRTEFYIKRI